MATQLHDFLDQIMDYEQGNMDYDEMIEFFQGLIDTGFAWELQGSYGRTAHDLINAGECTLPERGGLIMTMKHFISKSHIDAKLIRAVVKQSGGWETFKKKARNMAYAIDGGFAGFTWYADTVPFFKRNRKAILEHAEQVAQDMGEEPLIMIQNFGCFRSDKPSIGALSKALYAGKGEDTQHIMNCMTWFAGEEVARSYTEEA